MATSPVSQNPEAGKRREAVNVMLMTEPLVPLSALRHPTVTRRSFGKTVKSISSGAGHNRQVEPGFAAVLHAMIDDMKQMVPHEAVA